MSNGKPRASAFTMRYNGLTSILFTRIFITEAFDPSNQTVRPDLREYKCIWDTGATNSVITSKVITDLRLQPTGKALCHHAGGQTLQNTYLVAIKLPNEVGFPSVKVTEGKVPGFDVLIGMDIIGVGDFAVTKEDGKTVLSCQYPSVKTIDFVKRIQAGKPAPKAPASKRPTLRPRKRRKKDRKKRK